MKTLFDRHVIRRRPKARPRRPFVFTSHVLVGVVAISIQFAVAQNPSSSDNVPALPSAPPQKSSVSATSPIDEREQARRHEATRTLGSERRASLANAGKAFSRLHREQTPLAVLIDAMLLCFLIAILLAIAASKLRAYVGYLLTLLVVFAWSWLQGQTDYFWVFALGMSTAFAEIIGKFRDEPLQSVRTGYALVYHIFNGAIAMFALYMLEIVGGPAVDDAGHLKMVLVAGLGAMLVMRSKLFNIKIAGEDISFGPEQIVKIFLSFMEHAIDRIRACKRITFAKEQVENFKLDRIEELAKYFTRMMDASLARTIEQNEDFAKRLALRRGSNELDTPRDHFYVMCFHLLNEMGEDFTLEVFKNAPAEIRNVAPRPVTTGLLAQLGIPRLSRETQYYMSYGPEMSGVRFRRRFKWSEAEFRKIPRPRRCKLEKYRLEFNKPNDAGEGCANVTVDERETVEGVLYILSKDQMKFLDERMAGYKRRTMRVSTDSADVDAEVYFATEITDGLKPDTLDIRDMLDAAKRHGLSPHYVTKLRGLVKDVLESEPAAA